MITHSHWWDKPNYPFMEYVVIVMSLPSFMEYVVIVMSLPSFLVQYFSGGYFGRGGGHFGGDETLVGFVGLPGV